MTKNFKKRVLAKYLAVTSSEHLTLYHGTDSLFIDKIKRKGLASKNYHSPKWFMLSSTKPSAIFHSTYDPDTNRTPYLITVEIPITKLEGRSRWEGYPYVWEPIKENNYLWYALKQPIPKEFIKEIKPISIDEWSKTKDKGF